MTRNGKIARLPHFIRSKVNERLHNGEEGREIVQWLNGLIPVQELVEQKFGGIPVSEQNLSEWKQGGYTDWLRHQETRAMCRDFLDEAKELEEETEGEVMTDLLTETLAFTLMRLLREAMESEEKGPKQRAAVLEIAREFDRLRRGDHRMEQVRRQCRREDQERDRAEEEEDKRFKREVDDEIRSKRLRPVWDLLEKPITASAFGGGMKGLLIADYIHHVNHGSPMPDDWVRRFKEAWPSRDTADPDESDSNEPDLDEPDPTGSDPIRPDQAA